MRQRGALVVAVALVAGALGTGAGAAVAGPSNIEVFGWRPVGGSHSGSGAAATDASSQRHDPSVSSVLAVTPEPTDATPSPTDVTPEPTPTEEPVPSEPPADPGAQMVADVIAATNAQRTAAGLPALTVSSCATEQVTSRVAGLVASGAFEHPPLEPVLSACALSAAGENLAKGYQDGASVVDGWMNSEGHKANVLGDWTEQGVSCQLRTDGQWLCGAVYTRA